MKLEISDAISTVPGELYAYPAVDQNAVQEWADAFPFGWLTKLVEEGKEHAYQVFRGSALHGEMDQWGRSKRMHLRITIEATDGRDGFLGETSPVCEHPFPAETLPENPHVYLCQCGKAHSL